MQRSKDGLLKIVIILFLFSLLSTSLSAQEDHTFFSKTFNTKRWYRIYLPADYKSNPDKKYPVVYFFHGWSGRYKWGAFETDFDAKYRKEHNMPERKEPPFVDEWRRYTQNHDLIIVSWDGYEPLYEPGKLEREGIKYGHCTPYDFLRAHERGGKLRGLDYRQYFRELVSHIDSTYRTIADRAHRATTGLSMGGHMSYYIGGQSKDIISSVSAYCPADNLALFGPLGKQVAFPVLEMWRSLKGVPVRLTATDGDWLLYNDLEMKRLWENAGLTEFEFHMMHFPNHWAGDTDKQLDFHMKQFAKNLPVPERWNYVNPGFPSFELFGYRVEAKRSVPALMMFDHIKRGLIKAVSRKFIEDGPIIKDEIVKISSDLPYSASFQVSAFNLSDGDVYHPQIFETDGHKLGYELRGGGNVAAVSGGELGNKAIVRIVDKLNRDYLYFEKGRKNSLDIKIVNLGTEEAQKIKIRAFSQHPYITFSSDEFNIEHLGKGAVVEKNHAFDFIIDKYDVESSVGSILLEVSVNNVVADTQRVIFFSTPESPYISEDDFIILDGREVKNVPIYRQGWHDIVEETLSGGKGNGNGKLEKGEEALVFIRLPQGFTPEDSNTFHKTYLLNSSEYPQISVDKLRYDEKIRQAGATSVSSVVSVVDDLSKIDRYDLWFRVECLYNIPAQPDKMDDGIYARKYDYRRLILKVDK
jgi:hypothetical protein